MQIESGWEAVSEVLDGDCAVRPDGFDAETETRRLFVPYSVTTCSAEALVVCKLRGLVTAKLDAMYWETAWTTHMLTLPTQEPQN